MPKPEITADRLRALLSYDPSTGHFQRTAKTPGPRPKDGVGSLWNGYRRISVDGKNFKAHRLAWLYVHGTFPENPIDHLNGDRGDNRIDNLRPVAVRLNNQNRRAARRDSTSGMIGVSERKGRFRAYIVTTLAGVWVQLYLGEYETKEQANTVYLDAKRKLHEGCTI
jgi:hypothetical protein